MVQVTVQGRAGTVLQGEHGTQPMVRFWRGQGREHHRTGAGTLRIRQSALPLGTDSGAGTRRAPVSFSFGGQPLSKPSFQQLEVVPLSSPALLSYLRQREINTELAKRECREVRYLTGGQTLLCRWFSQPFGRLRDTQQALQGLHSTEGHHPHTAGTAEGDLLPL